MDYIITFIQNLSFVASSIGLIFIPFLFIFYLRNRDEILKKRPHFNQFMEKFFVSGESNCLVFLWAFFEATIWFVIPEFLLFLIIFMKVRHKRTLLYYDVAGTVVGTLVGLTLAIPSNVMVKIPYIYQSMIDQTHEWYDQLGVFALIHQPFSGVPYKVFLSEAQFYSFPIIGFIVLAVIIRIARYTFGYLIFTAIYPTIHTFIYRNYLILFIFAIVGFTLLLMRVSSLYI